MVGPTKGGPACLSVRELECASEAVGVRNEPAQSAEDLARSAYPDLCFSVGSMTRSRRRRASSATTADAVVCSLCLSTDKVGDHVLSATA